MHSLNVIRNLACGKEPDIQDVYTGLGVQRLTRLLNEKIHSESNDIVIQTIYIAVNFATGAKEHKDLVLNCGQFMSYLLTCFV